ncbi:hypothetical protein A1QO_00640 [Vibrio genomosp. F10 str. ZF-129]|uniref:Uncharacterized protein n=1 Tax=Vibrio genomosp. F10 str. ZF-129 TaxID=1187848 RepID=A0A1E5BG93_9VIBR|nr:hypothetical protein [Vibrio genomosp. F10]OEE35299.1 hypothetical protein A1QO_00640 [Vibrio genomosp. F10 str. ZF-129]
MNDKVHSCESEEPEKNVKTDVVRYGVIAPILVCILGALSGLIAYLTGSTIFDPIVRYTVNITMIIIPFALMRIYFGMPKKKETKWQLTRIASYMIVLSIFICWW